jgi:drug/metabolite transporter (DMT)-like permease
LPRRRASRRPEVARRRVLLGVVAACTYAVGRVLMKAALDSMTLLAAVPVTGVGVPAGTDGWLLVLALGIVPGVIGAVALLAAIGEIGPSLASILLTLEPQVTVLLAWLALDERFSAPQLAGGGVILAAMVVANRAAGGPPPEVTPA